MSYFIIQHNVQKLLEAEKKTKVMFGIDMYFQNKQNFLFVSKTWDYQQYFTIFQTKKLQRIQVVFKILIQQKYIKLKFKPIFLLNVNKQLIARSQRCIIELGNRFQTQNGQNKNNFYKCYINKGGYLNIQIIYSIDQFLIPMHVQFVMNKTLSDIQMILQQKILLMLPYLSIQMTSFNYQYPKIQKAENEQNQLSLFDKIKYISLLNEVYKSHRVNASSTQKTSEQDQFILNVESLVKSNNLVQQQDTPLVVVIQKQKQELQIRLKQVMRFIHPKIKQKREHLNMYKMYLIQKQYQKHVKAIKKKNLEIYQITNTHYRIVRGIENHISMSKEKILTAEGSHSNIFFGTYSLHLSQTLFTYSNDGKQQEQKKLVIKPLICKRIKSMEFCPSVNSFKNQMDFLFFVKDKRSKFIASYFLPMNRAKYDACELFAQYYQYNLKEYLQKRKSRSDIELSFMEVLQILQNVLLALIFMIENGTLHRDLKPFNVMIDEKIKARVIDFGSCCPILGYNDFEVFQKRMLTTPAYQLSYKQLPEQTRKKYSKLQYEQHILFDIFSFGTILKQMLEYTKDVDLIGQKQGLNAKQIAEMIIQKCHQPNPIDRVSFDELLYFIKLMKQMILQK